MPLIQQKLPKKLEVVEESHPSQDEDLPEINLRNQANVSGMSVENPIDDFVRQSVAARQAISSIPGTPSKMKGSVAAAVSGQTQQLQNTRIGGPHSPLMNSMTTSSNKVLNII